MITLENFYFLFFILCGLPVIIYPVLLMANIMSLAGHRSKDAPRLPIFMMRLFVFSTTFYPITYFFALYKYRNTAPETHHLWVELVVVHLLLIFAAFMGWIVTEGRASKKLREKN